MSDIPYPAPTISNAKLPLTNLTATGGTGQVSLSWSDPNPVSTGARIQRCLVRTAGIETIPADFQDLAITAGTSYTDSTALAGTAYAFRVYPVNPAPMFVEALPSNVATARVNGDTSQHLSVIAKFNQIYVQSQPYAVTDGSWGL